MRILIYLFCSKSVWDAVISLSSMLDKISQISSWDLLNPSIAFSEPLLQSMEVHGGLHGGSWSSVEVSIEVRGGSMDASLEPPQTSMEALFAFSRVLTRSSMEFC